MKSKYPFANLRRGDVFTIHVPQGVDAARARATLYSGLKNWRWGHPAGSAEAELRFTSRYEAELSALVCRVTNPRKSTT